MAASQSDLLPVTRMLLRVATALLLIFFIAGVFETGSAIRAELKETV